jgi:hypothetical protein
MMKRVFEGAVLCAAMMPMAVAAQTQPPSPIPPRQELPASPATPVDLQGGIVPAPDAMPVTYPEAASGYGGKAGPRFYLARWAEDWSFLRDRSKRTGPFDALKFIPLDADGDIYLTLSDEQRLRHDTITSPGLRVGRDTNAILLRNVVGADLHIGKNFRAFGQIASGVQEGGYFGAVSPVQRNDAFVQQLFAEVKGDIGQGGNAGIRVGRQDFQDGPIQLVSIQENPNIHITFDGIRAYVSGPHARIGLFDFRYTRLGLNAFDDPTDKSRRFSGVTGSVLVPPTAFGGSKLFFDPFFYYLRNRNQRWGATIAREERRFWGARLWGDVGAMNVDLNGNYQSGRYGGRDVAAYQVFAAQNFALGKPTPTAVRIGWRADYASGGGAYGTGPLRNASQLFGTAPYFSYGIFVGPTNYVDVAPTVSFTPVNDVRVLTELAFVWRNSARDAVYSGVGGAYAGTQSVAGHEVAQLLRLNAVWSATQNLSFTLRTEYLRAGKVLDRAGYADSVFTGVWATFRL